MGKNIQSMSTSRIAGLPLLAVLLCTGFTQPVRAAQPETIAVQRNFIQVRIPTPGSKVKPSFEFAGRTQPLAVITIETFTNDQPSSYGNVRFTTKRTRADDGGAFSVEVVIANAHKYVHVHVKSVASDGSSAQTNQSFAVVH
jgi:hypothetical protein